MSRLVLRIFSRNSYWVICAHKRSRKSGMAKPLVGLRDSLAQEDWQKISPCNTCDRLWRKTIAGVPKINLRTFVSDNLIGYNFLNDFSALVTRKITARDFEFRIVNWKSNFEFANRNSKFKLQSLYGRMATYKSTKSRLRKRKRSIFC